MQVSWWFIILLPLTACALFYAGMKYAGYRKHKTLLAVQEGLLELQILRARMNPIFIFNALNSIQDFILNNRTREASKSLSRFARLLRLILDYSGSSTITLARKIEFLKLYVELESLRFDQRFNFSLNVLPDINTYLVEIPTMLIQPFVENAIWHGLAHKQGERELLIKFYLKSRQVLICEVIDNGIGRAASKEIISRQVQDHSSEGWNIVSKRMNRLNRESAVRASAEVTDLYDEQGKNAGTKVVLEIPFRQKVA
jgi:LytS/YehU family sensor histidine kinase